MVTAWVIQSQNLSNVVDLTTDQTINGNKILNEEIVGTAQNLGRSVVAGVGLTGGGELNRDVLLTCN